jgi:hypothetical protein
MVKVRVTIQKEELEPALEAMVQQATAQQMAPAVWSGLLKVGQPLPLGGKMQAAPGTCKRIIQRAQ